MASISDLAWTNNLDSGKQPVLTDLETAIDSIQTYINASVKDNLVQLALDAFPAAYAFDSDGVAQYTNSLYDKLKAEDSYTGGDITISTTGAWTDVDTTNAALAITPELAGNFKVTFQFNLESVSSNATNATNVKFRLTDSSENSTVIPKVHLVTGVTATTNTVPVIIEHTFDAWPASLQTVKLQYYITTSTNTTIKVLADSDHPIYMQGEKI